MSSTPTGRYLIAQNYFNAGFVFNPNGVVVDCPERFVFNPNGVTGDNPGQLQGGLCIQPQRGDR